MIRQILFMILGVLWGVNLFANTYYSQGNDHFSSVSNWNTAPDGSGLSPVFGDLTSGVNDFIVQDGDTIVLDTTVNINSLRIGQGVSGCLTFGNDNVPDTLTVNGTLIVDTNAVAEANEVFSAVHLLKVYDDLTINGVLNLNKASSKAVNIEFYNNKLINGTPSTVKFNSLHFISGTRTCTYGLDINGNVILETAGRFAADSFIHTVAGNWTENGSGAMTFNGSGTIIMDGSIVQSIPNNSVFNNLVLSGGGIVNSSGTVDVNGDLSISNNTTYLLTGRINSYGDLNVDSGSTYNQTGSQLTYLGSNASDQIITCDGNVTFYNLYIDNGSIGGFSKDFTGAFTTTSTVYVYDDAIVGGDPTISMSNYRQDGLCNWSGEITFTGGTQYMNGNGTFTLGTAEVIIDGNCTIQAGDTIIVNGNVSILESRYWIINLNSALVAGSPGLVFLQEENSNLYLRGVDVFPSGFDTYTLDATSWQRYDQNYKQYVEGNIDYGYLYLQRDSCIAKGPVNVRNHLYLYNDAKFNLGTYDHHFKGYVYTSGKPSMFATAGTVYFDGADNQVIDNTSAPGIYDLNNVIVTDAVSSDRSVYFRVDEFNVKGDLRISNPGGAGGDLLTILHENSNYHFINDGGDSLVFENYTVYQNTGDSTFQEAVRTFDGVRLAKNSTIYFSGSSGTQWIPSLTYGNLWIRGNGNQICNGPLDINGNFSNQSGTPNFIDSGYTHTIAGNWDVNYTGTDGGALTGTFIFDGVNQAIETNAQFNDVIFSNTGTVSVTNWIIVDGNLTVENGATLSTDNTIYLDNGNLTVNAGGVLNQTNGTTYFRGTTGTQSIELTPESEVYNVINWKDGEGTDTLKILSDINCSNTFYVGYNASPLREGVLDLNGFTLNIGGYWYMYPNAQFVHNNGTIHMNGTSALQYLYNQNSSTEYYNMVFSGSAEKVLNNNSFDINGDVTINNAILNGGGYDHYVAGNWNNANGNWVHSGNLHFDGTDQDISQSQFWNVLFEGTATKTLTGNIDVNGGLRIDDGVTLDVGVGNNSINIAYWWDNDSTGTFVPRNGTVTFDGSTQSNIYTGGTAVGKRFYDFVLDKVNITDRGRTYYNDLYVENDLMINNGRLRTEQQDYYIEGSFINNGEYENSWTTSSLEFVGTSGTHIIEANVGGTNNYRDIHFNAPGATYQMVTDLALTNNHGIVVDDGTFDLNGHTISTYGASGNVTINGGVLEIDSAAALGLGNNATLLNAGGTIRLVGNEDGTATLQKSQTNDYTFTQTAGTLYAKYFTIKNTSGNGVDVQGGAIDGSHAFSNGTFLEGTGNAYLTIGATVDMSSADTAKRVVFNPGPTYNVSRTSGIGELVFQNPSGTLNGEANDEDDGDPGSLIVWDYPDAFFWDGEAGTSNWNDAANWSADVVPLPESFVFLEHSIGGVASAYTVNVNSTVASCYDLSVDDEGGNAITLNVNGADLNILHNISISSGSELAHVANTDTIRIGGSWINTGTFSEGTGTVIFNGLSGNHTITTQGAADPFYGLKVSANDVTYQLASILAVDGQFCLDSGTVDVSTGINDIYASGDWEVRPAGTFQPQTATVFFDNTGDQIIKGGTFYDFSTLGSGAKTLERAITVNGRVHIGAGTLLDAGAHNITVKGNWRNDEGNGGFAQTGVAGVIFSGDQNQDVGESAGLETIFNNVYIQGSATKRVYRDMTINGNLFVSANFNIYDGAFVTGTPTGLMNQSAGSLGVYGISPNTNFPTNFGSYNISAGDVRYVADGEQEIYPTDYYRLYIWTASNATPFTKIAGGDFTVNENFYVNDNETTLDMDGYTMTLVGGWGHPTGAPQPIWNDGKIIHTGADWNIDADLNTFHDVDLRGTGTKDFNSNTTISGDLIVQSGIICDMNTYTITSTGVSKTMTLSSGASLRSYVEAINGDAFPLGFSNYDIDVASSTYFYGADDQTILGGITYGNMYIYTSGNATLTSNLDVDGDFAMNNNATLVDANFNLNFAGSDVDIRDYTPGSGTMTFDGGDQNIHDGSGTADFNANHVIFASSGTKSLINDNYDFDGNVTIQEDVIVESTRPIYLAKNFSNLGTFNHTNQTVFFDGVSGSQTINPGINNNFYGVHFKDGSGGGNSITFTTNGMDIGNGIFEIDADVTVNMGALTHYIGTSSILNNGTLNTSNANLTFDRAGGQNIPALTAKDIVIAGSGNKTLYGDWHIDDLTMEIGAGLDVNNSANNDIYLTGNWLNNGATFYSRNGTVYFESNSSSSKTITTTGQWFYKVKFNQNQTSTRTYTLADETYIDDSLVVGNKATFDLNGSNLHVGNNDAGDPIGEVILVQNGGVFEVDGNATLFLNCYDNGADPQILVEGRLRLVGTPTNQASISGEQWYWNRKQIDINITTGVIEARYYAISDMNDDGVKVQETASIDATNNLSDGSFSNMRTQVSTPRYYMKLWCTPPPSTIDNITFNYAATPVIGQTYNVWRPDGSTTTITFDGTISGSLGGETYEHDLTEENSGTSRIDWPDVSQVTWTGNVSTEWENPLNWSPNLVPDSSIDAIIPIQINNPIINMADAQCRDLMLTNGVLTVDGYDLDVYNDVTLGEASSTAILAVGDSSSEVSVRGNWTSAQNGIFVHGQGTVTFNSPSGLSVIAPRNSAFYNLNINTGGSVQYDEVSGIDMIVEGDFTISSGIFTQADSWHGIHFKGDVDATGGTFDVSVAGHHYIDGNTDQEISGINLYRTYFDGGGTKTVNNSLIIAERTYVYNGVTLASGPTGYMEFNNNVELESGSTFDDGGQTHVFKGTWWYGNGNFVDNTGTIVFDGSGWMYPSPGKFNNWTIRRNTRLEGNVDMTGDLLASRDDINFQLNTQTFNINNTSGTGTFTLGPGEVIYAYGTESYPNNFSSYIADETSSAYYYGTVNQTIRGAQYGRLYLNENTTKTLEGDIEVLSHLYIYDYVTLDVSASNYNITIGGHFYNNYLGEFIARNGTVTFNSESINQAIQVASNGLQKDFYNVTINNNNNNNNAYYVYPGVDDITIQNNLMINTGRFNSYGRNITVGGDLKATGGTFGTGYNGTFLLNKAGGTADVQMNGSSIQNLTINSGATYTLLDALSLRGNYNLMAGTLNGNGKTISLETSGRSFTISGTHKIGAGGKLFISNSSSLKVNVGGVLEAVGSEISSALISRITGRYTFTVDGTIKAEYYKFEYMDVPGLKVSSTGTIDATNNFSNGTFDNCPSSGSCLVVENTQSFTGIASRIENVTFPTVPTGSASNVSKTSSSSGTLEFYDAVGNFSGEDFDNDPYSVIDWTGTPILNWVGLVNTDWYNVGNWQATVGPNKVPDVDDYAYINASAPYQPIIDSGAAECKILEIEQSASLTLNAPISDPDTDLYVASQLINNGILHLVGLNDTLMVGGSWTEGVTGSFSAGSGTVIISPNSGIANIDITNPFYNLVVDAMSGASMAGNVTVNNNFEIASGTFDLGNSNNTLIVKGSFVNQGTLISNSSSKVRLSATSGTKDFNPGSGDFVELYIDGGATYNLLSNDLNIKNIMYVTSGTLNIDGLNLDLGDCSGTDQLLISGSGTVAVGPNGTIRMGTSATLNVNSGGTIKLLGTDQSNKASVTRQCTGNYSFTVNAGGSIHAKYALFEYMNSSGINVTSGATVDITNNFSYSTFQNGSSSGPRLRYNASQDLTGVNRVLLVRFLDTPTGTARNVQRTNSGAGEIEFKFAQGPISGELYETDTYNKVHWESQVVWTGAVNDDWEELGNWQDGIAGETFGPDQYTDVLIPDVSPNPFPIVSTTSPAHLGMTNKLEVETNASLTINSNINLSANDSIVNAGTITINNGGTVVSSDATLLNSGVFIFNGDSLNVDSSIVNSGTLTINDDVIVKVGASWINEGTFTTGNSSQVVFVAGTGTHSINAGNGSFHDLSINSMSPYSAVFQTDGSLDIDGDLNINSGTLEMANSTDTIVLSGNFTNSVGLNGFDAGTATLIFNGSSDQTITHPSSLYNVIVANTGASQLKPSSDYDLDINGSLIILADASLNSNNKDVSVGGDWINNQGADGFIQGTRTVIFDGAADQDITNSETFYDLVINNSAGQVNIQSDIVVDNDFRIDDNSGAAVFNLGANQMEIKGNWLNELGASGFTSGTSTVIFNPASGAKYIASNDAKETFYNLTITSSGTGIVRPTAGTNVDINGDLLISASGILNVDVFNVNMDVAGNWTNNRGISGFVQGAGTETVTFDGTSDQTITSVGATENFNQLVVATSGGASLLTDATTLLNVLGDFTINAGGILDPEDKNFTFNGDWTNNNGTNGYVEGSETVIFGGSTTQTIMNSSGEETFNELIISTTGSGKIVTSATNISVQSNLTINADAVLDAETGNTNISIAGNWINASLAGFVPGTDNETVTFNGVVLQNITNSAAATERFNNLTIANSTGVEPSLGTNLDLAGNLTISAGAILDVSANSNDITIAGNWTNNNGADGFVQGTRSVTFDGVSGQQISNASGETFYNLLINNGGNVVTMNNNVDIENTLTFSASGYIDINANDLTLQSWDDGDIVGVAGNTDRFIIVDNTGYVKTTGVDAGETVTLPMGLAAGSTNFARADVQHNSGATTTIDVNLCDYVSDEGGCSGGTEITNDIVDYYWDIVSLSTDATVTLYWDASKELAGFDRSGMRMSRYDSGWEWTIGNAGVAQVYSGSVYSFSSITDHFTGHALQNGDGPLPVELLFFKASLIEDEVELTWETASEINNDRFEVERSIDAINFEPIDEVKSLALNGNSNSVLSYISVDTNPYTGTSYYRLKQIDIDGTAHYSHIVVVNNMKDSVLERLETKIDVYPNPVVDDRFNLLIHNINEKEIVNVQMTSVDGKVMYSEKFMGNNSGLVQSQVNVPMNLPSGVYLIKVWSKNNQAFKKLIVK